MAFLVAGVAGLVPAAAADNPTLLGAFKDWSAYTVGSGASKTCYALAQPKSMSPKNVTRDPVFFLISDWPARKAKGEQPRYGPPGFPSIPYPETIKVAPPPKSLADAAPAQA